MAFPGLPETSVVHNLLTNNVNVYVSKLYPSGLIFGGRIYGGGGLIFGILIGFHISGGGVYSGGLIYWGRINGILRYYEVHVLISLKACYNNSKGRILKKTLYYRRNWTSSGLRETRISHENSIKYNEQKQSSGGVL